MKLWIKIVIGLAIILVGLGIYWTLYLQRAHSTFDNYYKFRECTELTEKTEAYGICKLKDGSTIKIVLYRGKWFLDGDLPNGFLSF